MRRNDAFQSENKIRERRNYLHKRMQKLHSNNDENHIHLLFIYS